MSRAAIRHSQSRRVSVIVGNLQRAMKADRNVRLIASMLTITVKEELHGFSVFVEAEVEGKGVRLISFQDRDYWSLERVVMAGIREEFLT